MKNKILNQSNMKFRAIKHILYLKINEKPKKYRLGNNAACGLFVDRRSETPGQAFARKKHDEI